MKKDLRSMTYEEMSDFMCEMGQEKFRAKQIFRWIHARGAENFNEMTDLPKDLREQLAEIDRTGGVEIAEVQVSKKDGTRKYLLRLEDGFTIESVYMRYKYGNSICVSSQAGCRMGCKFCASAIGGLKRNLRAGEIEGQILTVQRDVGEKINHIVLMGTGEPFDNYDNVKRFIEIINSKDGLNIGFRRITVSTCGIVPKIREFACDFPQVNLAVSLHASDNAKRNEIMPVNRKYPMEELLEAIKEYTEKTRRRITYEYTIVPGVNDSEE